MNLVSLRKSYDASTPNCSLLFKVRPYCVPSLMQAFATFLPQSRTSAHQFYPFHTNSTHWKPAARHRRWVSYPTCRMRNRCGFQLPPRVPTDPIEAARAIELLGCCTQRKQLHPSTATELKSLVGQLPPNRLIAQQWKGAMQLDITKANRKANPRAFKLRRELQEQLHLSDDNRVVSRCFTILEAVRKRYVMGEAPNPRLLKELKVKLGNFPTSSVDTRRYRKALAEMQRERRLGEKRPPRIPVDSFTALYEASMLLGAYAVQGSVGRQTRRLENLVGAIPRNTNIARSWQKQIKAAIRKKKRRERSDQRRKEIDRKRLERQLRRIRRTNEVLIRTPGSAQRLAGEKYIVQTEGSSLHQHNASRDSAPEVQLQQEVPSLMACVSELFNKLMMRNW